MMRRKIFAGLAALAVVSTGPVLAEDFPTRTLTMINRYFKGEVPYPSHTAAHTPADDAIADTARRANA